MSESSFSPHWILPHPHLQTIVPNLFRTIKEVQWTRHRITTPDHDFLDLDMDQRGGDTLLLALHGLEGDTYRGYMRGMIRTGLQLGWDGAGLNMRGCSGENNRLYSSYHSGKTDDLDTAVRFITEQWNYKRIFLVGFSLGGNICLKYAGEKGAEMDERIRAVAGISAPVHLASCAAVLQGPGNVAYRIRFLRSLKKKLRDRARRFPDQGPSLRAIQKVRSFADLDNLYTAPAHGFSDAEDYWEKCSALYDLPQIKRPSIVINALDDTFLAPECYPFESAAQNPFLTLETPRNGGHVGFIDQWPLARQNWVERRVAGFLKNVE